MTRSRAIAIGVSLFLITFAYLVGIRVRERYGIGVFLRNESSSTLRDARLRIESKGINVAIPDLVPGAGKRIFVSPPGESHFVLEFADDAGTVHRALVVGYVESGYCGNARVTIRPGLGVSSEQKISPVACWDSWLAFF